MTRIRGITPIQYIKSGYCPKCLLWAEIHKCKLQVTGEVYSALHVDRPVSKFRTVTRCYFGANEFASITN